MPIPCPHFKITIVKRSQGQSAVAGAAYQSGERLFSEYDQKTKFYNKKKELVHAEIMLPSHAPPGYADRATLWNAVEAVENQWNSQLARRIVLAFPVEIPKEQYLSMIKEFCQEQFVSKGMIADFAIHDKGDGNPHAHILLTLRAIDEYGKWLPKARKVYDLDENGERIRLPSGNWKCHKENTVDWNDQKYAEVWRHSWETITNRYHEAAGRPERVDLRSFERQGIQQIPTVHLGPAAHQMEKRGVETFLGNLNRDIRAANSLMQSIRSAIRGLQRWITDLTEKKQLLLDALEKAKEPTLSDLLVDYFNLRNEQRTDWSGKAKLKCTVQDFEEVKRAVDYLKAHQVKAIKTVKRKITDLDRSKIEEQKKAVRAGYDMDIIPSDLATYGSEAKKLLQDLQSRNERMFLVSFLVLNTADNPRQLGNNIFQAGSIAQKYNCQLTRLDFQQEEGLMSCLPLGLNQIEIQRGLTTSSTAIFVPFTTQELFQNGKEALYYGINALSNNLIMVDRKLLKNPNGLILGTPGSGKSFSAKREIANCFLLTSDDVIICDPEAEYAPLVERLHGQVIKISPTSTNYINPMDLNLDYSDDESPLSLKSDFILSLCELIVGGKEGLQPVQKTIIDRCVRLVYQTYLNDPRPENMPVLEDLYNLLREQEEKEAQYIATALEIYVTGSLNVFNHQSNVDINNRIVCYDIKELGKQLKKIGMLVVQDQVWNRVTINRAAHKSTRYYIDEMHLLLKEEQTAAYTVEIWKRFRKWGGIPTGITQNVKDLLSSREVENIFENSDFVYMLNQAGGDRQILARQLGISPHQLSYVTHSGEGEGLLFYGSTILPFVDHFPKNTELYRIMTTKPQEMKEADGR